eukprot:01779_1
MTSATSVRRPSSFRTLRRPFLRPPHGQQRERSAQSSRAAGTARQCCPRRARPANSAQARSCGASRTCCTSNAGSHGGQWCASSCWTLQCRAGACHGSTRCQPRGTSCQCRRRPLHREVSSLGRSTWSIGGTLGALVQKLLLVGEDGILLHEGLLRLRIEVGGVTGLSRHFDLP